MKEIQEKLAEIIFENIKDGIIVLDRNYRILAVNKSIEKWTEKPVSEFIDKKCTDVFHGTSGICPHCAAEVTFKTGEIYSVAQKVTVKDTVLYAELSAYPIKEEALQVNECVVFIHDVTEKKTCNEEVLRLYEKVAQTKEYFERFIEDSADAIVTSDLKGIVTFWNKGAEKIYGFTKEEAIGKFLPFVPDFLIDPERENIQKIINGEILKDIEAFRKRRDGTIIIVSLTLSPINDASGRIIGISGISRDVTEKKRVEKELVRRNQELSRLFLVSSAMRGTLELERLLRMVLTAVTMSDGLGFNRAILFLVDEKKDVLKGAMGVGPSSPAEAGEIWGRLSLEKKTLSDIIYEIETGPLRKDSFFDKLSSNIEIALTENTILANTVKEKKAFNVTDVKKELLSDIILTQQLGTRAYAVVPLLSRDKVRGVLWVDNYFNGKPILEEDIRFLTAFSNHVATAIESATLYEQVILAERELENIFESISDMIYFISKDYVIKNINKAVSKRVGKTPEEIIGKKCYEVIHNMDRPWSACPHQRTIETKRAYVEEVEDTYLGGVFITSSSPIFDIKGEFIGTVNVIRDITELKRLQQKLVVSERMAALGEVAAKVAHEIRNPLVSIGGFARRLRKKLDNNLKEYADIIVREIERLEGILSEILGFVREIKIAKEIVNPNVLMEDIISLKGAEFSEKAITIVKEFGKPVDIFVDPNRLKEALLNILSNAVQAVGKNGTIYVKTYVNEESAVFEIKDTGPGIAKENLPFIFDPFFTTKEAGTGLGLAITHRIVGEHNGRIEVETRPNNGCTFRVLIPLKEETEK
ncbi:MAG: PAS domain S-box protein [Nitrospirota bacterium]